MELSSKVVVITGGSKGLGRAMTAALISRGAQVVICSRNKEEVEAAARELNATGIVADVTDESQVTAVAQQAIEKFGKLDIWINNAGVWMPKVPIEDIEMDKAKKLFDINVFGMIHGMRVAGRCMKAQREGTIINISSTTAFDGMAGASGTMYVASKYAIRGLTNAAREEFREHGVSVIGAYPGGFQSEIFNDALPAELISQFMPAEEVAEKIISNLESETPEEQLVMPRRGQTISHELTRTQK